MALVQNDIKKILAYSTLSQLGYMVMALGLRSSEAGMFHLTTHAFFKALLFLGAGSLIHALHTQDIWAMAETINTHSQEESKKHWLPFLFRKMPVTGLTFLVGTLALMGIPPLSGFFSKEEVLTMARSGPALVFWLAMATVFLTAFYMGRLVTVVFWGKKIKAAVDLKFKASHAPHSTPIHEPDWRMLTPLILLAIFSAAGGYLPIREMLPDRSLFEEDHALSRLSIAFALAGFFVSYLLYRFLPAGLLQTLASFLRFPKTLLEKKFFFDDFYDWWIKTVQENIARLSDAFERWVIVETGVNGTARLTRSAGDALRRLQSGVVQFYALLFTGGVTVILFFLILWGRR